MKLRALGFKIVRGLAQNLSQTPTQRHAAGFGGMTLKTDEPAGVNWNDATAKERERVGIAGTGF